MAAPAPHILNSELVVALKRLKLGRIADTLPERLVLADKQDMTFDDLLLLVLTDEIARRITPPPTPARAKLGSSPACGSRHGTRRRR